MISTRKSPKRSSPSRSSLRRSYSRAPPKSAKRQSPPLRGAPLLQPRGNVPTMGVPFQNWDTASRVAFTACRQSYAYDKALYTDAPELLTYRTSNAVRSDFVLNDGRTRARYMSDESSDQLAVFCCGAVLVLAFRGTDSDPMRFVGLIPDTPISSWNEHVRGRPPPKKPYAMAIQEAIKRRENKTHKVLEDFPFAPEFNATRACTSSIDKDVEKTFFMTRDSIIDEASKQYADINPSTYIHDVFAPPDVVGRLRRAPTSHLQGGAMFIDPWSDAASDAALSAVYMRHRWDSAPPSAARQLLNDPKHKAAAEVALTLSDTWIKQWRETDVTPAVLLCGHSLGGSLAYLAYLQVLKANPKWVKRMNFVGFNAALLVNFDYLTAEIGNLTQAATEMRKRCVHHRNHVDFVSGGVASVAYGKHIPTYAYTQNGDTRSEKTAGQRALVEASYTHSGTHGLDALQICDYTSVPTNEAYSGDTHGLYTDASLDLAFSSVRTLGATAPRFAGLSPTEFEV